MIMKKRNFVLGIISVCFFIVAAVSVTSCSKDECLTCTWNGETDEICESELAEFNRETGLNAETVGEVAILVELAGGSCR